MRLAWRQREGNRAAIAVGDHAGLSAIAATRAAKRFTAAAANRRWVLRDVPTLAIRLSPLGEEMKDQCPIAMGNRSGHVAIRAQSVVRRLEATTAIGMSGAIRTAIMSLSTCPPSRTPALNR